jgi:hypothetical protein
MASRWWKDANVLPFDVRAGDAKPVGWYRFMSPPGFRGMTLAARGKVQAWADGKAMQEKAPGQFTVAEAVGEPMTVLMKIEQERGFYAGATIPEYIKLDCGVGRFAAGDWSKNDALLSYSGGAWYRKTVTLPAGKRVVLDLGEVVSSAEVRVNGQLAGVKVSPPWTVDITGLVKEGENRIEVLVCNTLANHYTTIPTSYRGDVVAGLMGPVKIEME